MSDKTNDSGSIHPNFILYEELKISTCPSIVDSQQSLYFIFESDAQDIYLFSLHNFILF